MHTPRTSRTLLAVAIGIALAPGCATVPEKNAALERARAAYQAAAGDPEIAQNAAVELNRAQRELAEADRFWQGRGDKVQTEHYAYLAERRTEIARETAELKTAEQAVVTTSAERDRVLLQARTREAEAARRRADTQSQDAEQARLIAEARGREAQSAREQADAARARATEQAGAAAAAQERLSAYEKQNRELQSQLSELQAKQTERGLVLTLSDVLFDTGKADLKSGATRAAEQLSAFLKKYPERKLMIEGFTDSVGAESYNQQLSERRANAVRIALLDRGIDPGRMNVRGFGEAFPIASNENALGRQQNRRVEVIVSDDKGEIPARTAGNSR